MREDQQASRSEERRQQGAVGEDKPEVLLLRDYLPGGQFNSRPRSFEHILGGLALWALRLAERILERTPKPLAAGASARESA